MLVHLFSEKTAKVEVVVLCLERRKHTLIVRRVYDDRHRFEVLCSRPEHRRSADIDVLDRFFGSHTGFGYRRLKRIEVYRDEIDRVDPLLLRCLHMLCVRAPREKSAVNFRMKCLYAAVHDLGKTSEITYVLDLESGAAKGFSCAPG